MYERKDIPSMQNAKQEPRWRPLGRDNRAAVGRSCVICEEGTFSSQHDIVARLDVDHGGDVYAHARCAEAPTTVADMLFGKGTSERLKAKQVELEKSHRERIRREAWEKFAAAAMMTFGFSGPPMDARAKAVAETADALLVEWAKRFAAESPTPEEAAEAVVEGMVSR